jgi:hypothetical protein
MPLLAKDCPGCPSRFLKHMSHVSVECPCAGGILVRGSSYAPYFVLVPRFWPFPHGLHVLDVCCYCLTRHNMAQIKYLHPPEWIRTLRIVATFSVFCLVVPGTCGLSLSHLTDTLDTISEALKSVCICCSNVAEELQRPKIMTVNYHSPWSDEDFSFPHCDGRTLICQ